MDKKCQLTAITLTLPTVGLSVEEKVIPKIMIIDNSEEEIKALIAKISQLKAQNNQRSKCLKLRHLH